MTTLTNVQTASRPTRAELLARVPGFAAEVATGAAERDLSRELPFKAFERFRQLELGTLRIPVALGGPGGSVADYIEMIAAIGAADSNVAHALRSHFNYVENVILSEPRERDAGAIELILSGKLFGGAHTEQGTARPGQVTTTIVRQGDTYRLNGRKWYATGTAFSDFASFSALDEHGQAVGVLLPVDRHGITILDDWDGMGQRLTASGGVILENVEVFPHEFTRRSLDNLVGRHCSTLRQLHLAASAAGAVRNVLSDGLSYVSRQARSAAHSMAETATQDPFVQQVIGEIAANSFAIDTAVAAAASALDRTVAVLNRGNEAEIEDALIASALSTARAQLVLGQLGLRSAERLFDLGGGSATSRNNNFDRHWRNIRTVLNHNPLLHKARVVGDYLLNGTTIHLKEGKVF
ncbi:MULTISPECIES: acyl-CoA dehydrogenase family protein [Ensifer]|uniref:acyl-CoA dehydrogenase family protein n=1 Tax=Ensifer TaxID=106591 RepID=UPI00070D4AC1|nr:MULTISPECIES: acyl-CoA dehydrogenase family protein [unclassified Ensifer]KQU82607.1 acyl-CoA dehydrogenase [Ensifer sp. Root31]KQW59847.1 acyl-CoA dehydrogenase [Ensifer sp. Root1252]KQW78630.1 acyl-CoA dehydrogenase [Ensifer sp. Root127]KQY67136.1 acyl-CoA dehydrogenase [Ensifer sp. Root142]KRC74050.1 acyl-CoA dehydrogenase [Ensifer sp. Root231]